MKNYYNTLEFNRANDLKWIDPEFSLKLFDEYFKKYPFDYCAYQFYIGLLINLNYIQEARDIKNKVHKMVMLDSKFQNDMEKMAYFNYGMIYTDIRLSIIDGDYHRAIELVLKNRKLLYTIDNKFNFTGVLFYCRRKLGLLDSKQRNNNLYIFRQILEYHEDDFRDHVKKHMIDNDENNNSVFNIDFPFDKVLDEIKKIVPNDKKIRSEMFVNNYFFKYNDCGRNNYKMTNYFQLVTLSDSSDFITMYPSVVSDDMPHIDLNYLKENEMVKEKRMSQIDKFYKRYQK